MYNISNYIKTVKTIKGICKDEHSPFLNTCINFKLYITNSYIELALPGIFAFKIQGSMAHLSLNINDNPCDNHCDNHCDIFNNIYDKLSSQSIDITDFLYCNISFAIEYIRNTYSDCKQILTPYWTIDINNIIKTDIIFEEKSPGPIFGPLEIEI
jgi:hypothetical protein